MTVTVYCCAACGDEFESEFSMEESIAEYEENFRRKFKAEDVVPLCDDCYIEAMNEAAKAHLAGSMQ